MSGRGGKNVELQPQMRVCFSSLPETYVRNEEDENAYTGEIVLEIQNEAGFPVAHQYFADVQASISVEPKEEWFMFTATPVRASKPLHLVCVFRVLSKKEDVPAEFSVQLKAEVSASKIKAKEFDHLKPVLFPVWTVPFHFVNESLDTSLWERQIMVTPQKTLKVVEALPLLHQGFTGAMVWNCSRFMVNLLKVLEKKEQLVTKRKSIVDLSSGTGSCGMAALSLGAAHVTLTDLQELVPLIQANLQRNGLDNDTETDTDTDTDTDRVKVEQKQWEDKEAKLENQPFDLLLVSDLTYDERSSYDLINCVKRISAEGSTLLLVHRLRNEPWEEGVFKAIQTAFACEQLQEDFTRDYLRMKVLRGTKRPTA